MMPDAPDRNDGDAPMAKSSIGLDELCVRISNIFVRGKLSPPFHLKTALEGWLGQGLTPDEIINVVRAHLQNHRSNYHGSGDSSLAFLRFEIAKAAEAKHPAPAQEPERPQRARRRVLKLHNRSGFPDAYVEGDAARALDRGQAAPIGGPSVLRGYDESGEGFSADLED
jgi:hypothetical protein